MVGEVLVVGDLILDRYVYGTVDRISPEAPVPVLNISHQKDSIGGAGIVAENLVNLGHDVILVSIVGGDDAGRCLKKMCKDLGIKTFGILIDKKMSSILKTRFVATSPFWQYILRTDLEELKVPDDKIQKETIKILDKLVAKCSCVVISDYKKGTITRMMKEYLLSNAKRYGKKIIVDAKANILDYKGADIIAPNRKELFEIFGYRYEKDIKKVKMLARQLFEKMRCTIIVKLGDDGVYLLEKDKEYLFSPAAEKIVNVSGAGDVFIAILTSMLLKKKDIVEAVKIANKGAGMSIGKEKPSITLKELESLIKSHNL
ncbi:MAG: PfkB family carbohydrate kinase [Candidatus Micrarchaeota archaeon]|nr:PfkB family carbohydrate kinase [Candidatus Micrarchaeota archaeon]